MEIAKPPDDPEATTRISMFSELTGQYVRLGDDAETRPSHVFLDGVIDKECPFLFNAGSYGGNYTKVIVPSCVLCMRTFSAICISLARID